MGSVAVDLPTLLPGQWLSWLLGASLVLLALAGVLALRGAHRQRHLRLDLGAAQSRLDDWRQHDALTGLPTRDAFEAQIEAVTAAADRQAQQRGAAVHRPGQLPRGQRSLWSARR